MVKICFYVPASHLETVKNAMFAVGAGKIGDYDCCCWQVKGTGQFRPLEGSQPYIGTSQQLEQVEEYRVELVCERENAKNAVKALKQAHPYEAPAYDVMALLAL